MKKKIEGKSAGENKSEMDRNEKAFSSFTDALKAQWRPETIEESSETINR